MVSHEAGGIFLHLGNYGVRIFFLISGFLITGLLLKEHERSGRVSLKNFYIRRVIRIFPAFYGYVAVIFALTKVGFIRLQPGDLLHTLTYTMNYHSVRDWYLNHTWSLSVEEQFYLLWPATLVFAGPKRAERVAGLTVLIVPLIRLVMYFGFSAGPTSLGRNFQAVCDALATGCLLAMFYNRIGESSVYERLQAYRAYILIPLGVLALSGVTYEISPGLFYVIGQTLANIGGILLLDYAVRVPGTAFGRILNTAPLVTLGIWSYSIYLWQEVFLHPGQLPFPLNFVGTMSVSLVSYYGLERTFLRLRHHFGGEERKEAKTELQPT
jgi:peptidoglycan/LPS O-acetylase OafA/YrhL